MPQNIENRATLTFSYGDVRCATATSNLAVTTLQGTLSLEKLALGSTYRPEDEVTYIITVDNNGSSAVSGLEVRDDLGTFTPDGATEPVTPLTYIGPALLFINGAPTPASLSVDSSASDAVVFTISSLPAGANALIVYKAAVNEFAPVDNGSITNTAVADADDCCEAASDYETITAEEFADVRIIKQMCPDPVVCGEELTYTVTLYNYGNLDATNVQLTDIFDPAPSNIAVYVDGVLQTEGYTYDEATGKLTIPTDTSEAAAIPAATFTRDATTGAVITTPGQVTVVVRGTI